MSKVTFIKGIVSVPIIFAILAGSSVTNASSDEPMPATNATISVNKAFYEQLNFKDKEDFKNAHKGFIAPLNMNPIKNSKGDVVWDSNRYSFIKEDQPASYTVNPSLWRQAQLQNITGLFKVVDGVYQVRGQDLSVLTIVEGKTGLIVLDTLSTIETAKAAMELYFEHRPKNPVSAIVISHSHADHFGGIKGIAQYAENPAKVPIIVPTGFNDEALSENILLGNIMSRRAGYMFGNLLPSNDRGFVTSGIGPGLSNGTFSYLPPTTEVKDDIQTMEIDGITFKFLLTPDSEAPSEMHYYINDYKTLVVAENTGHTLHNIYTLRGAKTRDTLKWVKALDETVDLFGNEDINAMVTAHTWPIWGKDHVLEQLESQRDLYKYIHDQTIRLANLGLTPDEIAEKLKLPEKLDKVWANRGYYGTLKHNVKAVYNFYLGYFNGNPSDLDPLPQEESGAKYIEYMGGEKKVIKRAKLDYKKGEYRWVAQVLKHVVMANPKNTEAKNLLAKAYEQLGYTAESSVWRNFYLTGAEELRNGVADSKGTGGMMNLDTLLNMPMDDFMKFLSIKLNGTKAENKNMAFNMTFTDSKTNYMINLDNSVLNFKKGKMAYNPDATLTLDRITFYQIALGREDLSKMEAAGKVSISGDKEQFEDFLSLLDQFQPKVNIVTP
ncbi:alkyl sulfatase dimerization domain-containing protein [Peribacillus simplex]|uniref:alkyl/aryl-sulfatase n=1 Tax=Peribacillus simplex TaxID=1478 RepID=UPI002E25045E|nr:alkyl sulfatase dimerization domain-containing protein [Peribacillus simplex]MED3911705.1 alkyl sulfatase dimerization domain-containing protein [Peribacillus simplex]